MIFIGCGLREMAQNFHFQSEEVHSMPLRLVAHPHERVASFWIVSNAELHRWMESAAQALVDQLAIAVGSLRDSPLVLVRPLRESHPPVLVWEAEEFHRSRVVPQVHLPVGYELHPQARPQAIKSALEWQERTLTWITLETPKRFAVHSVYESAFRPLRDCVEYMIENPITDWTAWSPGVSWEFQPFDVLEEERQKQPKPKREFPSAMGTGKSLQNDRTLKTQPAERKSSRTPPPLEARDQPQPDWDEISVRRRLAELEQSFLASHLPFDAAERWQDWHEMAGLHFRLQDAQEGMLCLSHAVWNEKEMEPDWLEAAWRQSLPARWQNAFDPFRGDEAAASLVLSQWDKIRSLSRPLPEELSHWVLGLVWLSATSSESLPLHHQLRGMQEFLEQFENELPARVAWLSWRILTQTISQDVLTLARARDRFLERLFQRGIRRDRDCPRFLRSLGPSDSKGSKLGGRWVEFRPLIQRWSQAQGQNLNAKNNLTAAYLDLILAFGLARQGETATAKEWLASAGEVLLRTHDPLHEWTFEAYRERIEDALKRENPKPILSGPLLERLEQFQKRDRFKLDRLRQASRILEPGHSQDSFLKYHAGFPDELAQELENLKSIADPVALAEQFFRIKTSGPGTGDPFRILLTGLELAPRMTARFSEPILNEAARLLENDRPLPDRLRLLGKALEVAAHFDLSHWIKRFLEDFRELWELVKQAEPEALLALESFLRSGIQSFRRYGLRDEVTALLDQLEQSIRQQASVSPVGRARCLSLFAAIAGGRFCFDMPARAWPILDEVREALWSGTLSELQQTQLAKAYIQSLGLAPGAEAQGRLWEFFDRVQGIHDAFSTSSHFLLSQLAVAETLVLSFDGDASPIDPLLKKRLDDEEFCLRQRIHRDLRNAMNAPKTCGNPANRLE